MKRTFVLLTLVAALVAAPAFAETTFSGSVEYQFGTDFTDYNQGTDNDTAISLDGTVGEFTTISVGIEADDNSTATATEMTLTQDVTGALGLDSSVTFAYKMGLQSYSPADYSAVAGYEDFEVTPEIGYEDGTNDDQNLVGAVLTFGLMDMINLDFVFYPESFQDGQPNQYAVNAYGSFENVDASVYYSYVEDITTFIGLSAGATFDALTVGAIVETELESEGSCFGLSAQYAIDAITPGVAFKGVMLDGGDFVNDSSVGVNVTWDATEAVCVWGAVGSYLGTYDGEDFSDIVKYEVGVCATLDGVSYSVGYTDGSDFMAYDAEFADGGNMFFSIGASF